MSIIDPASLRFVIPYRRAAWRAANPDVINCMRPGPFGNPFVPVDPRNPEHVWAAVEAFRIAMSNGRVNGGRIDGLRTHFTLWKKTPSAYDVSEHLKNLSDSIRDLATRDHTRIPLGFKTRRFGCSCPLDAPACHRDAIIELYLKHRKELGS